MWGTYKRIRLLKWAHILPINPFFKCPWMVVTRSSRVVIMKINLEPQSHPCRLWCFQVCLHNVRTSLEPKWEKIQIWLRSVWTYVNKQKKTKQKKTIIPSLFWQRSKDEVKTSHRSAPSGTLLCLSRCYVFDNYYNPAATPPAHQMWSIISRPEVQMIFIFRSVTVSLFCPNPFLILSSWSIIFEARDFGKNIVIPVTLWEWRYPYLCAACAFRNQTIRPNWSAVSAACHMSLSVNNSLLCCLFQNLRVSVTNPNIRVLDI